MLIEVGTGKPITKVPLPERFRLLQRLTPEELEAIDKRINELIDAAGGDIATAGWLPGGDWTGTPFDPIYQKAARRDYKLAAQLFGLRVWHVIMGYEVFDGNRTDVTTVQEIVGTMEGRYGKAQRVWVMDRGMTSRDNLAWLQQGGRRYLIGATKQELKNFAPQLRDQRDWQEIRAGVEAKLCPGPDGKETFVLVRSSERQAK